jgi:hypothetical protein
MLCLGQVQGTNLDGERLLALMVGDQQAFPFHLIDMGGPHVDQGHVFAGTRHMGRGIAADRPHSDHRDFLAHELSPGISSRSARRLTR